MSSGRKREPLNVFGWTQVITFGLLAVAFAWWAVGAFLAGRIVNGIGCVLFALLAALIAWDPRWLERVRIWYTKKRGPW